MGTHQKNMLQLDCSIFLVLAKAAGDLQFWTAVSEVIFNCVDKYVKGFCFQNPQNKVSCKRTEDAFVDDTGLAVDSRSRNIVETLQHNSQVHERYLYITGGKLALETCF